MKNNSFYLLVFSLLVFVLASEVLSAPVRGIVPVPINDKGGNQVLLYKESHALVIGVSEYTSGWPRLPGVMDDVREVTKVLEGQGFNVVVVRNPTRESLAKVFDDFINKYGHGEDNRLLFYFAGHGYTDKPKYGGEMGYIVPADAPDPNRDKNGFLNKAMDVEMFNVYAKRVRAKHAMFLFDSCFSGSLFALSRAIPEAIQVNTSRAVRQFITAGTAEQTVPDRSIFRDQLVRALNGEADLNKDGYVTGTELGLFLEDTVTNYSRRSQTPKYGKISDPNLDKGDFVFVMKAEIPAGVEQEKQRVVQEQKELAQKKKNLKAEKELAALRQKLEEDSGRVAKFESAKPIEKSHASLPGMVKIPGGMFYAGLQGESDNQPHTLEVSTFSIDKYEVTQADFERVKGNNPSYFKGCPNCPVERVTWHEADGYCKMAGKRLPTEWEWEKAAKGGTTTAYYWGDEPDNAYGWWYGNSGGKTHPVGQKKPNNYGLYDMSGNVWEWTSSDWDNSGQHMVLRGGSWDFIPSGARSAYRDGGGPSDRGNGAGFRCAQ